MRFREFAETLRQLRIKTINDPSSHGFVMNNGTWLRAMETELYYEIDNQIQPAHMVTMFYIDTDPEAKSPEAQLIRVGMWKPYEAGWLVLNIKGDSLLLAKVTPSEQSDLDEGWVTDSGQLVLRRNSL